MMIWFIIICLSASMVDGVSLYYFLTGDLSLFLFSLIHIIPGLMFCLSYHLMKHRIKHYTNQMMFLFFSLCYFLPFIGVIASAILIIWLQRALHQYKNTKIKSLHVTYINRPLRIRYGIGGLHMRLTSPKINIKSKISAITKTLSVAPNKVNSLVRTMLSDNNDEVRLLAFQILNKQERQLMPKINQSIQALKTETDPIKQYILEKKLAFEYWELLYRDLVEPHMAEFATKKALSYGEAALEKQPDDSTLLTLLGRLALKCNDRITALGYFNRAAATGEFKERLIPYIAEIAYQQKKFQNIKHILNTSDAIPNIYVGESQYQFWNEKHEA